MKFCHDNLCSDDDDTIDSDEGAASSSGNETESGFGKSSEIGAEEKLNLGSGWKSGFVMSFQIAFLTINPSLDHIPLSNSLSQLPSLTLVLSSALILLIRINNAFAV